MTSQYHAQQHDMASGAQDWGKGEKIQGHLGITLQHSREAVQNDSEVPRVREEQIAQRLTVISRCITLTFQEQRHRMTDNGHLGRR